MIYIKDPILESYERMLNQTNQAQLTEKQINFLNKYAQGWSYNKETGLIDLESFDCAGEGINKLPVRFGICNENFICNDNQLISLEGCPSVVGGVFNCIFNQLTSLEGSPKAVGGFFNCNKNFLTTLTGIPDIIGGSFFCNYNQLTSLEGCHTSVGGDFWCMFNRLTSLEDLYLLINKVKGKIYSDFGNFTSKDLIGMKHLGSNVEEV